MFKYLRNKKGADGESASFFVVLRNTQTTENQQEAWYTADMRATLFCVLGIADAPMRCAKICTIFVPNTK